MAIMTVTGPIDTTALGITLAHEHLFLDLRNQWVVPADPEERRLAEQKVGPENLAKLRQNPFLLADNLLLDDMELTVAEVTPFQQRGGKTIVDCTSEGICRAPEKLRELSRRTGLQIVAGCGFYTYDTHPPQFESRPVEAVADRIIQDLTAGIGQSGIRAGIIGEIGTSSPIRSGEMLCLRAAARAQRRTGTAIQVHTYPWGREGLPAVRCLLKEGVDPAKIAICHVDVDLQAPYIRSLLQLGVYVEFDDFGKEFSVEGARSFAGGPFATDRQRVEIIRQLLEEGWEKQILTTTDVCLKCLLHAYGGGGYDHLLQSIVPLMRECGISAETVEMFLVKNPARLMGT